LQPASIGRIVIARTDPYKNNGAELCPAIITRVWNDVAGDQPHTVVNLKLFHDGDTDVSTVTSARLFADEQALKAWEAAQHPDFTAGAGVAYWPPRVG
jgi:hypothetical protein